MSISGMIEPEPEANEPDPLVAKSTEEKPSDVDSSSSAGAVTIPSPSVTAPTEDSVSPEKAKAQAITNALLARLAPVGEKANFKILIYGPPGGAKSSFLGGAENNLIYDQEDGLVSIKTAHIHSGRKPKNNIQAIPFTSFAQADLLLDRLAERIPELEMFDVFSVDTMNDLYRKALTERIMKRYNQRPSSVDPYMADQENNNDYSAVNEQMIRWVRRLRDLDRDVIVLAHSKTVEPKNKPAITFPDFSEGLANKIEAMMDIVGYMEMKEIDGKNTPVLRVSAQGGYHAKTRIPLPNVIVDPTYDDLRAEWSKHLA